MQRRNKHPPGNRNREHRGEDNNPPYLLEHEAKILKEQQRDSMLTILEYIVRTMKEVLVQDSAKPGTGGM